jgi:hypothetical protein
MNSPQNRKESQMDNLTKIFWKNEAVRLNKELEKEKAKFDKFVINVRNLIAGKYSPRIQKELLDGIDELSQQKAGKE